MPKSKKRIKSTPSKAEAGGLSRRALLRGGAAASAVVLGGGFWGVSSFRSYAAEHDLTRVGKGDLAIGAGP